MDKIYRKQYRKTGDYRQRIGVGIGIHDKNNIEIRTGDEIIWNDDKCIVLWNTSYDEYWAMLLYSKWYGDNIYDSNSYGKGYRLKMNNSCKMQIEIINKED